MGDIIDKDGFNIKRISIGTILLLGGVGLFFVEPAKAVAPVLVGVGLGQILG